MFQTAFLIRKRVILCPKSKDNLEKKSGRHEDDSKLFSGRPQSFFGRRGHVDFPSLSPRCLHYLEAK